VSLTDYQKQIDDWVQAYQTPYWTPLSQLARLIEEIGELARIYNHQYGEKVKKSSEDSDDLEGEMGDILYGLICMANREGVDLDAALQKVILKSKTRDANRFEKKTPET